MKQPLEYVEAHFEAFVGGLKDLLRIPSVSTDPAYADQVSHCAQWLVDHLTDIGVQHVELVETKGHPLVYAEHLQDERAPTLLAYAHYDVQPPDPIDLWKSNPFEPTIRDNKIFARGACDDKGQLFLVIKAIEAFLKTSGGLPCNLKLLFEGEEESGSESIARFVEENPEKLQADFALVCDTAMVAPGIPAITISLRGIVYTELSLRASDRDLHSGVFGGAVENPLHVLSDLIAGLHDQQHRITIPGFYDDVLELSESERVLLQELPFDEKAWLGKVGVAGTKTEEGYSTLEAATARPTLDVHGIWGGYAGDGAKTIIPARAGAKISCRLVRNQDPDQIFESLKTYFDQRIPKALQHEFRQISIGSPILIDRENPAIKAAMDALEETFQAKPYFTRQGGSIPIVAMFKDILKIDSILMGFGLGEDAIHAPNESFGLDRFRKGIESVVRFFQRMGDLP